ncbi:hypothetical protein BDN70DRAFT_901475 [Pholiota conissans]|uniref:Uncharacterized protein n=1 Tax=Pholiota conissans TaxID=109636 RepID=A0A9P5YM01_9AGAR|nr:hypothetical protein BDN70DRAFT_901475 [Pholiota conissans]
MSRTQNSLETPAPPALQSADTVKLNWIFFDRTSPIAHSAAIFIPRNLFEEALQNCVELFIRRLYEEYYLIAHAQDIIFWKPRNALLIEDAEKPGWVASVDDDERDLFDRCPTYLSLSNILAPRAVNDEKMVHLVLAEGDAAWYGGTIIGAVSVTGNLARI